MEWHLFGLPTTNLTVRISVFHPQAGVWFGINREKEKFRDLTEWSLCCEQFSWCRRNVSCGCDQLVEFRFNFGPTRVWKRLVPHPQYRDRLAITTISRSGVTCLFPSPKTPWNLYAFRAWSNFTNHDEPLWMRAFFLETWKDQWRLDVKAHIPIDLSRSNKSSVLIEFQVCLEIFLANTISREGKELLQSWCLPHGSISWSNDRGSCDHAQLKMSSTAFRYYNSKISN